MFERSRVAQTLRGARESQGLSLEQAAAGAGIPLQYLRLLEGESNVRVGVSDELYLIPFFRRYARFIGIDADELLPEFLGVVQQIPSEASPPLRLAYRSRWGFLWKPVAVVVTIAIAVVLMLRQTPERPTFEDSASNGESDRERDAQPVESRSAVPTKLPTANPTAVPELAIANSPISPEATPTTRASFAASDAIAAGEHELRISAIEEAWLSLTLEDHPPKQYLLRAGESRSWTAARFSLTVGNAGGVTLAIDDHELPPIGRSGQVIRNLRLPEGVPASSASPLPSER
jgi:cytoskeletal protein RodZ